MSRSPDTSPTPLRTSVRTLLARPATVLVVEGPPGTGTSGLWAEGVAAARRAGATVLTARAFASETGLAWTGLGDLLDDLDVDWFDVLPPAQRAALDTVLLRGGHHETGGGPIDRAVAVAVLHLLRSVAAHGPLLLAIDDVQWTDVPTQTAMAFALRRLSEVHVLLTRHGDPSGGSALLDGVPHVRRLALPPPGGSPAAADADPVDPGSAPTGAATPMDHRRGPTAAAAGPSERELEAVRDPSGFGAQLRRVRLDQGMTLRGMEQFLRGLTDRPQDRWSRSKIEQAEKGRGLDERWVLRYLSAVGIPGPGLPPWVMALRRAERGGTPALRAVS